MVVRTGAEPPPRSTDVDGWRLAIAEGRHTTFRLEDIVAALQDLGPRADKDVLNPLAKHLSDALLFILRKYVSTSHPNKGSDIIERTHGQIVDAVFLPISADGKALRDAFVPRVKFRLKDAIKYEVRTARAAKEELQATSSSQRDVDAPNVAPDERPRISSCNPTVTNDERIDVECILDQIPHDQKRLAFRLFMDGIPYKSKKSNSIEKALGISEKTAREWIKEMQDLLSAVPAVQELLNSKQTRGTL